MTFPVSHESAAPDASGAVETAKGKEDIHPTALTRLLFGLTGNFSEWIDGRNREPVAGPIFGGWTSLRTGMGA
jgi:hypothetical protein